MSGENICVIACGVLTTDVRKVAKRLGVEVDCRFLEAGLHERPSDLRRQLQEAIDEASSSGKYDQIAVGYGLCGRGTLGIESRGVPLAVPKVHDCIALFLGSDKAYREQFSRYPGTFYISEGWYREKSEPLTQTKRWAPLGEEKVSYDELAEKYGPEVADQLFHLLNSWQRNYQRAAFIDTGAEDAEACERYAQAIATEFGWKYERIQGDLSLLEKLLQADRTTDEILVVPPEHRTDFDPVSGTLMSHPIWMPKQAAPAPRKRVIAADPRPSPDTRKDRPGRIGLGVDAGGTYTDAVIYDLAAGKLLDKKKAPTTKWDFTVGIGEALADLDPNLLESVELAALSTTLATNAIVEGKGQKVGLLFMPPYGLFKPEDIAYEPKALISGRLEITGEQIQPVDSEEVRRVAREMVERFEVRAFAVSGFAGAINPEHELLVKELLRDETGLFVTCGHELSDILDFRTRARTAVMNGRIIPLLAQLLEDLEQVLRRRGIRCPVVVVKGDGTLMSKETALERPVETILSGPAASVAGARHLTGRQDAIVVDMGGTTTDTAMLREGQVTVCESGSYVGGKKTHVKALRIRTVGLGGDSFIAWSKGGFEIGPQRVASMAWLGSQGPGVDHALDFLVRRLDEYRGSTNKMQILVRQGHQDGLALTAREADIVRLLEERPFSLQELAERTGLSHWSFVPIARLEEHFMVQRCGLTPTDLLNGRNETALWDVKTSMRMCEIFGEITGMTPEEMIRSLLSEMVKRLALEVFKRQLDAETDPDRMEDCEVCQVLTRNVLGGGNRDYSLQMRMHKPIIGIGAPVHLFLGEAASLLGAEAILPEHADVANAIGAVTSHVRVRRQVKIRPSQAGGFVIEGLPGAKRFLDFDEAMSQAEEGLIRLVRELAVASGTTETSVEIDVDDHIHTMASGSQIFLRRTLSAELTGEPDHVSLERVSKDNHLPSSRESGNP